MVYLSTTKVSCTTTWVSVWLEVVWRTPAVKFTKNVSIYIFVKKKTFSTLIATTHMKTTTTVTAPVKHKSVTFLHSSLQNSVFITPAVQHTENTEIVSIYMTQ